MIVIALSLLAGAAEPDHLGQAWIASDLPLVYEVSTYNEDTLPDGYALEMIPRAYAVWPEFAPCAGLSSQADPPTEFNTGTIYDFNNRFGFDDPKQVMPAGTLAWTLNQPNFGAPIAFNKLDRIYKRILDSDIVFNDNVNWATEDQMNSGTCNGSIPMINTAIHEIGHQWGMAHTCEKDEICTDPARIEATMNWTNKGEVCTADRGGLNSLDIQNITSLYGPYASFECSHELNPEDPNTIAVGIIDSPEGFTLKCRLISDSPEDIVGAEWNWGDGSTSTDLNPDHTYTESGNFTVRACFDIFQESCGNTRYCFRNEGYVRACATPEPIFSVEPIEGLTYQMLNNTNLNVYGCIWEVQWDIFDDTDTLIQSVNSWEPKIAFSDPGQYRVVLNLGGPAGTGAAELTVDIKKARNAQGNGCSTLPAPSGFGLLLLPLIGLLRRRK